MRALQPTPGAPRTGTRPTLQWQVGRLLLAGSRRQAFLDQRWIGALLQVTPPARRRSLALRLLSLSPHYFIYQWERYPRDWSWSQVLDAESERNRATRAQIAERILAPLISDEATVLDFGCGPGYLAARVRKLAREVVAVDVSRGTLACAQVLNPGPSYARLDRGGRLGLPDESIDLVYSIAVFQHIDPGQWPACFRDFVRVLRPGGVGVLHLAVAEQDAVAYHQPRGLRGRYSLRFEEHGSAEVSRALLGAGFVDVRVEPVLGGAGIDDDVGHQHVATFRKPA